MADRPPIIRKDWAAMALGERIHHLEVEGYLVFPDLLDRDALAKLAEQARKLPSEKVDYSIFQELAFEIEYEGGAISDLIALPAMTDFLHALFGPGFRLMTYFYSRSSSGYCGASLHCDGEPWGSETFGFEESCPRFVRVLYYLQDMTPENSAMRIIPGSHLSLHNDGNPYLRYERHPDEKLLALQRGSAVLLHHHVFHGTLPNTDANEPREMLALTYRPEWAGPLTPVTPRNEQRLVTLAPAIRLLMGDPNKRTWFPNQGHKPENMKIDGLGIDSARWKLE